MRTLLLVLTILLTGCVSTYMKQHAGVGSNISSVILIAGPPDYQFYVSDNRRAFQWYMGRYCVITYFTVRQGKAWMVESINDPDYAIC